MSRPLALLLLALVSTCGGTELPPNLVVVTLDTVRADRLGCYGYFRDLTPHLDALAEEAVLFEECHAPVAQTLPTHTSLFTGLSPREHGVTSNLDADAGTRTLPPESVATLAEVLAERGYDTAAFVSAEPLKRGSGVSLGFETWFQPEAEQADGELAVEGALYWLRRRRDRRPYFLWVHLYDAHAPYAPHEAYDQWSPDSPELLTWLAERDVDDPRAPRAITAYDAEIAYVDDLVGRVLGELREGGAWERTALCVTSDHGEAMGQHGLDGHGDVWREQLHVPLLLRWPGATPRRDVTPLTTRDVLPTLLGRVPSVPAEPFLAQATGRDVLATDHEPRPPVGLRATNREGVRSSITLDGWRLIVGGPGGPQLFDLAEDPHELEDVADRHPERVEELRSLLRRRVAEELGLSAELGPGRVIELGEDDLRQLEALGYTGE